METTRLIEQYLAGSLDKDQKSVLDARIESDPSFRNLVNLYKEADDVISDKDFFSLQQMLEKIQHDLLESPAHEKARHLNRNFLRIAAVFILLVASGFVLKFTVFNSSNPERIFNKFYQTYDADLVLRNNSEDTNKFSSAILNYTKGNYPVAIAQLNDLLQANPGNYIALFYHGLACLGTEDAKQAVLSFEKIPESWESPFKEHRDWYLALALLKEGSVERSAEAFKKIKKTGGYYAQEAGEILDRL